MGMLGGKEESVEEGMRIRGITIQMLSFIIICMYGMLYIMLRGISV